jgi:transcriptional regulator with XRE-family HTH domain
VSVGTIQNYEHGRVHITTDRLEQLARALQCEPVDLLMPPGSPLPRYRKASLQRHLL